MSESRRGEEGETGAMFHLLVSAVSELLGGSGEVTFGGRSGHVGGVLIEEGGKSARATVKR